MKVKFTNPQSVTYAMLNNAVCKDDLRPAIQQVCIDLKEKKLIVTDAHVLVAYPIEITENETNCEDMFLVPPRFFNHLKYMVDVHKKKLGLLEYFLTDEYAEVYLFGELVYRCKYADYKYPTWKNVMPNESESKPLSSIGLNLNVLKQLCNALPNNISGYEFIFTAQNKAVLVKSIDESNKTTAIIMSFMLSKK